MQNILTTIPKTKYPKWDVLERTLKRCTGPDDLGYWLINMAYLPTKTKVGDLCYMIYDGQIRGYMDIVDTDDSENYRDRHDIGKPRATKCMVLANWHPIAHIPKKGSQGWGYTALRP